MRLTRMVGFLAVTVVLAGCSSTNPFSRERLALPIGPSYAGGRGMQLFPTSPDLLNNVKDGMSDVGIHSIVQNEDPGGLIILEGKTADDRKARVTVQTSGANSTVSVKISWFGDEPLTRAMLDRIGNRQGTMPPQPTPATDPADKDKAAEVPKNRAIFSKTAVSDADMMRDLNETGIMPTPPRP